MSKSKVENKVGYLDGEWTIDLAEELERKWAEFDTWTDDAEPIQRAVFIN